MAHTQFKVFGDQVKAQEDKLEAVIAGIKPVLDSSASSHSRDQHGYQVAYPTDRS